MNSPFAVYQADPQPARPGRFSVKTPLVVFLVCLVLGLGVVIWRTSSHRKEAESHAREAAAARAAAIELELNRQLLSAVEVLATLARQYGGTIPNFQRVAADLQASRPGLVSLELQPGGIVSEIVPRTGHERVIGLNVLKSPVFGASAAAALRSRALTVTGPVQLYRGEWGIVARVPVFQRGRDGRESFAFVAGAMRLGGVLTAAELADLAAEGYDYDLFIPAADGQKAVKLASHGSAVLPQPWHPTVRVQNLNIRIALQPHGGLVNKAKLTCEVLGVLLVATLLGVLANLLESRGAIESALAEANQRVDREAAERKKAQEQEQQTKSELAAAQAELRKAHTAQEQAESAKAELQQRLEESVRHADEAKAGLEAKLKQREQKAAELQKRLDVALHAADDLAQGTEAKYGEAQATIKQLEQTLAETQARLQEESTQAQEKLASAAQAQAVQEQAAVAELQAQLEAAARAAAKTEASVAKLKKAEAANQELKARLKATQQDAEKRIGELTAQLEAARAAAQRQPEPAPMEPIEAEAPAPEAVPAENAVASLSSVEALPVEGEAETASVMAAAEVAVPEATAAILPEAAPIETAIAPAPQLEEPAGAEPAGEVSTSSKPAKQPKRRKLRRDNQMDLFGGQGCAPASVAQAGKQEDDPAAAARLAAVASGKAEAAAAKNHNGTAEGAAKSEDKQPETPDEAKPVQARRLAPAPPVDLPELRKAVNVILPLLMDQDPGAKDCLKDNRTTFRSAFTPEGYVEFEQLVKSSEFVPALEHLKRAARKHGVSV